MLTSPFSSLSVNNEKKLTIFLSIATASILYCMLSIDYYLINTVCKNGILSFELAKDFETSEAILNSWNVKAKISAGISVGLDFLFLMIYPLLIALLIHKLNKKLWKGHPFYNVGLILLFSQLFTAIFDAIENVSLIQLLLGSTNKLWSLIAYYFAFIKFTLIVIALLYLAVNFILLIIKNTSKNE
ncbi:hypothetical protein [Tenacibaculum insulae]|uniref:hypothetical protein n=1 Tax=Tenacibaculum insulae TaxID=2029677 RepID=UPI003AB4E930